jgi:hypothetical protein
VSSPSAPPPRIAARPSADDLGSIADLILSALHREYPSHVLHLLRSDEDARPPRALTPAFYGSFDWHSSVHGHWALARLLRADPSAPFAARARAALSRSLTEANIEGEVAYVGAPGREGFERPYGLVWLLQLAAELREWGDAESAGWLAALAPLEALASQRLAQWLDKLPWPVRSGVHSQTAFALGLMHDWTRKARHEALERRIAARAVEWFGKDENAPIGYEPSGNDFLSPVLGEADLMRRVVPRAAFSAWLDRFLPALETEAAKRWLTPVSSPDPADGHLAHLDGLNLSRAWMLRGIAHGLGPDDQKSASLADAAERHSERGLKSVSGEHYAGAHWLGSFATYLLTARGLGADV